MQKVVKSLFEQKYSKQEIEHVKFVDIACETAKQIKQTNSFFNNAWVHAKAANPMYTEPSSLVDSRSDEMRVADMRRDESRVELEKHQKNISKDHAVEIDFSCYLIL